MFELSAFLESLLVDDQPLSSFPASDQNLKREPGKTGLWKLLDHVVMFPKYKIPLFCNTKITLVVLMLGLRSLNLEVYFWHLSENRVPGVQTLPITLDFLRQVWLITFSRFMNFG